MQTKNKGPIQIELSVPTVFPVFNSAKNLAVDTEHSVITVQPMKHKHFRKMETLPDNKKIHYLMQALTGMETADLDELDIDDSAELTRVLVGYMRKYVELARSIMTEA